MKKIISLLLVVSMLFVFSSVAFAGSWQEAEANKGVKEYCTNSACNVECTGSFGCTCCAKCPNALNDKGEAVNIGGYASCRVDSYLDLDVPDSAGNIIHKGDQTTKFYWKSYCCPDCTGTNTCRCNCGCPHCVDPLADDGNLGESIEGGLDAGRNGFVKGIQAALNSMRKVMYDLFDRLFEFLRLEDLLGKTPNEQA